MFYCYVLYSIKDHKLYKGFSADIGKRFLKHCAGGVTSTKNRRPLILIYCETFEQKSDATKRERWFKTFEGHIELINILKDKNIIDNDCLLVSGPAG